jgi:uncharacterized membrane protein (DUF485 family)
MNKLWTPIKKWLLLQVEWIDFSGKRYQKRLNDEQLAREANPVSDEIAKKALTVAIAQKVERGWRIEMQNEFDAILSKRRDFNWILHVLLLLLFLVLFAPLALFWLFVMVILAVTRKRVTRRVWVEKNGEVFER